MLKFTLCLLAIAVAVSGNPAATGEWRWTPLQLTVSPNIKALPFPDVVKVATPQKPFIHHTHAQGKCGSAPLAPTVDSVIVGGSEVMPHTYPWQVALFIDNLYFCGGSIISDEWVLTAAHCASIAHLIEVVAGAHNIQKNEPSQQTVISKKSDGNIIVHEGWKRFPFIRNDIALVHLPRKLQLNDFVQPVCLPASSEHVPVGTMVTPTGWGMYSDYNSDISPVLREVTVPVMSNKECAATYGPNIQEYNICVTTQGGKGTCNGDSGGPLNHKSGAVYETRGITSFGAAAGCELGYPGAFTRVSEFLGWIKEKTGI